MISASSQSSAYFPLRINKSQATQQVVPLQFPSTRNILWESKPVGDVETLSLLTNQNVQLFIVEKSLRLAHRYSEGRQAISFLLGSVYPKSDDDGGICFGVDRFDPGREVTDKIGGKISKYQVPTAVVPGDHVIPIKIKNELLLTSDSTSHTKDEFACALQILLSKICGKDSISLSNMMSLKANVYCSKEENELTINLHCGAIVPNVIFQALPIAPLPIIPTALARNLAGPLRLSDVQGTPKMGYITMDQTRKLLLLLESDPKVYGLPLIGLWVSGVHSVHHPYVWASCLRYLNCSEIKDRVLRHSKTFLLLHYSVVQRMPDFWECSSESSEGLDFELLSCHEELLVDLEESSAKDPLCFHLPRAADGINKTLFDEAISDWKDKRTSDPTTKVAPGNSQKSSNGTYDENPRPSPSPHPSPTQGKASLPPVPEDLLSLSIDDLSSNVDKQNLKNNNGNILAPCFDIPAKQQQQQSQKQHQQQHVKKSKNSKLLEPSRPPLKPIISPTQNYSRNTSHEHFNYPKSITPSRKLSEENKENTPVISRPGRHNISLKTMHEDVVGKAGEMLVRDNCRKDNRPREFENKTYNSKKSSPSHRILRNSQNHVNVKNTKMNSPKQIKLNGECTSYPQLQGSSKTDSQNQMLHDCGLKTTPTSANVIQNRNIASVSPACCNSEDIFNERESMTTKEINATSVSPRNSFVCMVTPSKSESSAYCATAQQQTGDEIVNIPKNCEIDEQRCSSGMVLQEKQRSKSDSENNKVLEEQVKKQEDMIKILQQQVRSLLKMKEDLSSPGQGSYLPLTPASTPEQHDGRLFTVQTKKQIEDDVVTNSAVQTESTVKHGGDDELKPNQVTIGVNTGTSLLWDNSPKSTSVQCCECIRCSKDVVNGNQQLNNGNKQSTEENHVLIPDKSQSLVEVSEVDVKNDTNESLSVAIVDIPSFTDSSSTEKQKPSSNDDSSSGGNQPTGTSHAEQSSPKNDTPVVKGKEYYDQLLCQVKDLLNDHIGNEGVSLPSSSVKNVQQNSSSHFPTREGVVMATMRELDKIKNSENEGSKSLSRTEVSSSVPSIHQRSLSTSFIPDHLRFNYVSMVADETFDEIPYVDEITRKYLSDEELQEPTKTRSLTVRFDNSLPTNNGARPSKDNLREVDFTWNNFSICTKNYLTKYNLVERHISMAVVEQKTESERSEDSQIAPKDPCKPPFPSPKVSKDKNEILDIRRLKKLPKLF